MELLNGVVQESQTICKYETKSTRWSLGLNFVQWQINISENEAVKTKPLQSHLRGGAECWPDFNYRLNGQSATKKAREFERGPTDPEIYMWSS